MLYKYWIKYRLCFLLIVIAVVGQYKPSKASTPEEAIVKYEAGDFTGALDIFDSLYKSGAKHSDVCYNIGNCYFRLNEIGNAILFYERALALSPQQEDVLNNLELTRSLRVDSYDAIPRSFFATFLDYSVNLLSSGTWAILGIVLILISLLIYLGMTLFSKLAFFKSASIRWLFLICFISGIGFSILSFVALNVEGSSEKFIILKDNVYLKSAPEEDSKDLFILHEGTDVLIRNKRGEWLEIQLSDGKIGWLELASGEEV